MKFLNTLFATLVLFSVAVTSLSAQTITVGTATGSNATTDASPINIWYRSLRYQTVYTAAELTAAGATAGTILQLGWNVTQVPQYALPNYTISMKHTTAADASAHDGVGLMQVYNTANYSPVAGGFDMLTLQTPFAWNGTDNILIDVCFDQVVPTYASSGQVAIYSATNGGRYVRSDIASQCGLTTTATLAQKPVVQLVMGTAPSCAMTSIPSASAVTSTGATLSWTHPGTPTGYIVEYGTAGFTVGTGTFVATTLTNVALSGLTPATDYEAKIRAVCGTAVGDTSFASTVYFATSCPASYNAPITESFGSSSITCLSTTNNVLTSGGGWNNVGWVAATSSFYSAPTGYDGDEFMYFETQGAVAGATDIATFLPINLSGLTNPYLDFYYYMDYQWGGVGSLKVEVQDAMGTWNTVFLKSGEQNTYQWMYAGIDLISYANTTIGLRVTGTATGGWTGGVAIDRIRVKEGPVAACAAQPAPYTSSFEDAGALNSCWEQSTMDNMNWVVGGPGGTPSASTGPSGASTGTYYLYIESSSPASPGDSAIITSPPVNTSNVTVPALYFKYHMRGNDYMKLRAEYTIFGSDVWTPIWEQVGAVQTVDTDPYAEGYIPLPAAAGMNMRVRFVAIVGANDGVSTGAGTGFSSDIAIDDVKIDEVISDDVAITSIVVPEPNCGFGNQPITVQVINRGFNPQGNIPVFLSINGGTPVGGAITATIPGNGGTGSYTFMADMSQFGAYTFDAYTALLNDDVPANDAASANSYSQPAISTIPYTMGWDADNGHWYATGEWEQGTPDATVIDGAGAGTGAFVTNLTGDYADNMTSYLTSPCFDLSGMLQPVLRFSINWDLEDDWDGAWVEYSTNGGTSWDKLGANNLSGLNWYTDSITNNPYGWCWTGTGANGSNGWVDAIIDLQPYGVSVSQSVRFRFVMATDASTVAEGVGIDNFGIFDGCPAVVMNETLVNESVAGLNNGSITLNPVGGLGFYTYLWSNNATTNAISNLAPGTYSVTVTDIASCATTATFTVGTSCPASLGASVVTTPELGDNAANGSAQVTVTGGAAPYTYAWSNGNTSATDFGLTGGDYTVTITDANGCTQVVTISIATEYLNGTENIDGLTGLMVSPNPATDFTTLNINFENAVELSINIVDVTGRVLETRHFGNTASETVKFEVSTLAEGVYFMNINANGQSLTKRFVVIK